MQEDEIKKEPKNYYLPIDVIRWIEDQAKLDSREPSNFITALVRRLRDSETDKQGA